MYAHKARITFHLTYLLEDSCFTKAYCT